MNRKYIVITAVIVLLVVLVVQVRYSKINKNVFNAFVVIDEGLLKSTANFIEETENYYMIFDAVMEKSPNRVMYFREMAYHVKYLADRLHYDIQELKVEIVKACDGEDVQSLIPVEWYTEKGEKKTTFDIDANLIIAKDNMTIPAQLMLTQGKDKELKEKIENFMDLGLQFSDTSLKKYITNLLNTELPPTKSGTWESHHFSHLPMIAVIANLSKMQNNIRNTENHIVQSLLATVGAGDSRVNRMEAIVMAKSNCVMKGDDFEARILLAAYDTLQKPEVLIGAYHRTQTGYELVGEGKILPYDTYGRVIYKAAATMAGNYTLQGIMRVETPYGVVNLPFIYEYQVGDSKTP